MEISDETRRELRREIRELIMSSPIANKLTRTLSRIANIKKLLFTIYELEKCWRRHSGEISMVRNI